MTWNQLVASTGLSRSTILAGCALLLAVTSGRADEPAANRPRVRLSSFGTLGLAHSSQADVHATRGWGQADTFEGAWSWRLDSLLGVQMNATLTDKIDAAVQVVAKDRHQRTLEQSLEWAFLAWQPFDGLVLRGGRLGIDIYMLSDYRNVGFAYLWQRPPLEFYGPLFPFHVDGVDLTYQMPVGSGTLLTRLFAGTTEQRIELQTDLGIDTLELNPFWGGSLSYESEHWRLKAGFAQIRFANNPASLASSGLLAGLENPLVNHVWPQAAGSAEEVKMQGKGGGFYSLGAAFEDTTWLISGELGYLDSDWKPVRDSLSAYLSIGRRWGDVTPYLLLSSIRPVDADPAIFAPSPTALNDPTLAALYGATRTLYRELWSEQHTLSLGLRWDMTHNLALKFQWDRSDIESGGLWSNHSGVEPLPNTQVDLFSASLNWMF